MENEMVECDICGRTFKKRGIGTHMRRSHPTKPKTEKHVRLQTKTKAKSKHELRIKPVSEFERKIKLSMTIRDRDAEWVAAINKVTNIDILKKVLDELK